MSSNDKRPTDGFGPGWKFVHNPKKDTVREPFLIKRLLQSLNESQRVRWEELSRGLTSLGILVVEPERPVGPNPAGAAIFYDGCERAITLMNGRSVAEWVRDALNGACSAKDVLTMADDILATTPKRKPCD